MWIVGALVLAVGFCILVVREAGHPQAIKRLLLAMGVSGLIVIGGCVMQMREIDREACAIVHACNK